MREHLDWVWMSAARHTGGDPVLWHLKVKNGWKPVVMFCKPPLNAWWSPFCDWCTGGREKDAHDWQQSLAEAEYYIGTLCPAGGIVVDPMLGSGTSGVAAVQLGMEFVGIECDSGSFAAAQERLDGVAGVEGGDGARQPS